DNQVSIWLESELPTYLWLHRVPSNRIKEHYLPFFKRVTRVVFDSSLEPLELRETLEAEPDITISDLAKARNLPVRQSIGQFLSSYDPGLLVRGLSRVEISCKEKYIGEAHALMEWQKSCLASCASNSLENISNVDFNIETADGDREVSVEIKWTYQNNGHYFRWNHRVSSETASIQACFGQPKVS